MGIKCKYGTWVSVQWVIYIKHKGYNNDQLNNVLTATGDKKGW